MTLIAIGLTYLFVQWGSFLSILGWLIGLFCLKMGYHVIACDVANTQYQAYKLDEKLVLFQHHKKYAKKFQYWAIGTAIFLAILPSKANLAPLAVVAITAYTTEQILSAPETQKLITILRAEANTALDAAIKKQAEEKSENKK